MALFDARLIVVFSVVFFLFAGVLADGASSSSKPVKDPYAVTRMK